MVDYLEVGLPADQGSAIKKMALDDAKKMQDSVIETSKRAGRDPPAYHLMELIGKGSYGRVYKGKDLVSASTVAIKIIDIDTSDLMGGGDTYSEFLKEVKALKTLSEVKARNINHVIDAFPVDQTMWMVTEYCGGGSVATLMRPAPNGLREKFIIPILREVAEAVKWVHQSGLIHRDIKCANVLITEEAQVQLCDFGIAAPVETKIDKRTTCIGTPHWMAPELFDSNPSYGKEVDIWAFGAMAYEIATGLPPNALPSITMERLGQLIKQRAPRLEGDYSEALKDLVALCMQESPRDRPEIQVVQQHYYVYNTDESHPTASLKELIIAFRIYESKGGARKSLFNPGGAQAQLASTAQSDDNWNFSTTEAFDDMIKNTEPRTIMDPYGGSKGYNDATTRPAQRGRRRPPAEVLAAIKGPLEKVFDPHTSTNYDENSRVHYGRGDLPLRDDSVQTTIRDTMINYNASDQPSTGSFSEDMLMETIRAGPRIVREDYDNQDFSKPALSDPADLNANRRTQDWKFPTMLPPASAEPDVTTFSFNGQDDYGPDVRPPLIHHPTEPIMSSSYPANESEDRFSLIDLDLSLPVPLPRPSTANSDVPGNPFELERHASLYYDGPSFADPYNNGPVDYSQESPPHHSGSLSYGAPHFTKESSPDSISLDREYTTSRYDLPDARWSTRDDRGFNAQFKFGQDKISMQETTTEIKVADTQPYSQGGEYHVHHRMEIPDIDRVECHDTNEGDGRVWVRYEKYNGFWVPPWVKDREERLDHERPDRIKEYPSSSWANFPDVQAEEPGRYDEAPSVHLMNPKDPRRFTIEPWSKELEQYIKSRDNSSPTAGFNLDEEMDAAYEAIKAWNSHKSERDVQGDGRDAAVQQRNYNPANYRNNDALPRTHPQFFDVTSPPSVEAMMGIASDTDIKMELDRLVGGLLTHLDAFKQSYETLSRRRSGVAQ